MKTPAETLDITLQAAILQLGRTLSAEPPVSVSRGRSISPDVMAAEVERVLALVRASPARRLFGVRQNFVTAEDAVRLKAVAFVVWQMIGEGVHPCVHETAKAVADGKGVPCEQILLTRDYLGKMACEGLLVVLSECCDRWNGRLVLPKNTYSWMAGGRESKGDFDPGKITLARLRREGGKGDNNGASRVKVPSARQLFDTVRKSVFSLDPQIRVLASRIVLHAARAEWLQSGKEEHAVGNTVILLAGSSGSGKSFLVERMAAACSLPFVQVDSTTLTASGYVGADVDSIYQLLTQSAGNDPKEASRGIAFLDEFDKKSTRYGRDVGGEAVQMELLSKLQSQTTPFVVGGKRSNDGTRAFLFDGRATAYCLAGVFSGLDEIIKKQAGKQGIGFASEVGHRSHIRVSDCLKRLGFLDELVNRISCVVRLPDPTHDSVLHAFVTGIVGGFNDVLAPGIFLMPTESAAEIVADYAIESRGFYRSAKAVLATVVEELLFEERGGTVPVQAGDVRRAIERLTSGIVQPAADDDPVGVTEATQDGDADAQPEAVSAGG